MDVSKADIEALLPQMQDSEEKVIEYCSKVLTKAEGDYRVMRKELLAVVKSIGYFYKYTYKSS